MSVDDAGEQELLQDISPITRNDSKTVWFEAEKPSEDDDANSQASFGRAEIDSNTLGPNFDKKVHF